jgi:hypothetical protein
MRKRKRLQEKGRKGEFFSKKNPSLSPVSEDESAA